jgi:hypothetical protein
MGVLTVLSLDVWDILVARQLSSEEWNTVLLFSLGVDFIKVGRTA